MLLHSFDHVCCRRFYIALESRRAQVDFVAVRVRSSVLYWVDRPLTVQFQATVVRGSSTVCDGRWEGGFGC